MKFPLPSDTFPRLSLSEKDECVLEDAAEVIVKQTSEQYHEHLSEHDSVVDETRWKKIKQREDVRVYRERRASYDSSGSTKVAAELASNSISILTFGSIPGNLDDVMYGLLNSSSEAMQLKSAYIKDGLVDWAVLATIHKHTEHDPYRELSIQWTLVSHPLMVGAVLRMRDAVFIESIGIAQTPNGERIGYHLHHSVEIPEIRELTELSIVRLKVSYCQFFRQRKDNCVEVYGRGLFSTMGDASAALTSFAAADFSVAVWQHVHCGEMKKLTRMLTNGADAKSFPISSSKSTSTSSSDCDFAASSRSSASTSSTTSSSVGSRVCDLCAQKLGGGLTFSSSRGKQCRICSARVCSRCRVSKTVHLPTHVEKQLASAKMAFCTRCIFTASCASSYKFAVLDALAADGKSVDYTEALRN